MTTEKIVQDFENLNKKWLDELMTYSPKEFAEKPSEFEWTMGQLYNHLLFANKDYFLKHILNCLENNGAVKGQQKTWQARLILVMKNLPPRKYRVPKSLNHVSVQPQNQEDIIEGFSQILKLTKTLAEKIQYADAGLKTSHPTVGYLNAKDWLQFMVIHMKHHLRQKRRLDKFLGRS